MTSEHAYLLFLLIDGAVISIAPSYGVVVPVRHDGSLVVLTNRAVLAYSSFQALSSAGPTRQNSFYDDEYANDSLKTRNRWLG